MDKTLYLINLFDYYEGLLTDKQKEYFKDYYFNNLSLSEISENKNISRNAIHKVVKETENKLNHYEECLRLYEKSIKIKEIIKRLDKKTKEEIEELL